MEKTCENNEAKSDLFVRVKATKSPKFRAPAELSSRVTMVAVEVNEEENEKSESFDLNLHVQSSRKLKIADAVIK